GAARAEDPRQLRAVRSPRRQAAIPAPPAAGVELSPALARPSDAGGARGLVHGERAAAGMNRVNAGMVRGNHLLTTSVYHAAGRRPLEREKPGDGQRTPEFYARSVRTRLHRQDHGDRRNLAPRVQDRRRLRHGRQAANSRPGRQHRYAGVLPRADRERQRASALPAHLAQWRRDWRALSQGYAGPAAAGDATRVEGTHAPAGSGRAGDARLRHSGSPASTLPLSSFRRPLDP